MKTKSIELNKIYNEDCFDVMSRMPDNFVDLVLTDIPYGECQVLDNGIYKIKGRTGMSNMSKADTVTFALDRFLYEIDRVCKGSFYIFCGIEQISEIKSYLSKICTTRLIIWEKTNPMPINGEYVFLNGIEACIWGKKPKAVFNTKCRNTVFRFPLGINKTIHPTTKPLKLFEEFVKISTNVGDKVFDPCMGSGTTALACKALGRDFIGSEINEEYFCLANKRLAAVQGALL